MIKYIQSHLKGGTYMFGMIKMQMRRSSYFPEITLVFSTDDDLGDKILLGFFFGSIVGEIEKFNGILEPIKSEYEQIEKAKATLICEILFKTEGDLQLFQEQMLKGGRF